MLTLPSCLVDDPAPFPESKQTPPRLDYHDASPLLDQIIFAQSGQTLHFRVPVASEDAGDELSAQLFLDYSGGQATNIARQAIRPSTLDDTTRAVTLDWPVSFVSPGCHRLTLRVTHHANLDVNQPAVVFNTDDLAEAYWWANVDADQAPGKTLADCPSAVRVPP